MKLKYFFLASSFCLSLLEPVRAEPSGQAQSPTLKISGFSIFETLAVSQKETQGGKGGNPTFAVGPSDLYFTIAGKSSSGFGYKYRVNFEAIPGSSVGINKNYIEFDGDFGTIQAGNNKGPEDTMQFSGRQMTSGASTIDGALNGIFNNSAGVISGVNMTGETKYATKLTFYSPHVSGFQLGVSYTPDTSKWGDNARDNGKLGGHLKGNQSAIYPDKSKAPFGKNNVVIGLRYQKEFGDWVYGASVIGVREKTVLTPYNNQARIPVRNANSYQLNANIGYKNWNLAGGFIDNRKSRLPKVRLDDAKYYLGDTCLGNAGKAWDIGTNYTSGAYQFGVAYHRTNRKTGVAGKASSHVVATTLDYVALPGLKFFGEVDLLRKRTNSEAIRVQQAYLDGKGQSERAIGNNRGTVFVLGTKVSF